MNKIKLLEETQGKPVWVWRPYGDSWASEQYWLYRVEKDVGTIYRISQLCAEEFERDTGLKLNPGEYTRTRFGVSPV